MTAETIEHVAQLFEEHGSIVWWERDAKTFASRIYPPGSPNGEFKKETDIMDVWFDSGSSWNGVVVNRPELKLPSRPLPRRFRPIPRLVQLITHHICCQPWRSPIQTNLVTRICP